MKNGLTSSEPFRFGLPSRPVLLTLMALLCLTSLPAFAQDDAVIGPDPKQADAEAVGPAAPEGEHSPKALAFYHQGITHFGNAKFHGDKGNEPAQKRMLKASIDAFEAALKADPGLLEAQSNIGFVYLTENNYGKAIKAFEKALRISPNHLNTLNGLATAYAFDNEIPEAIRTFDQLTTLDPANPQYFFNKGSVLQKAGRMEEAQAAYQQALNIDPSHQRTLFNLGTLRENQGNLEEALTYYQQAKGAEVGNTIGLEAINRLQAIEARLASQKAADSATGEGPAAIPGPEAPADKEHKRKSRFHF